MAYSDKDIVITPSKGLTTQKPTIRLTDGGATTSATISLGVETVDGRAAFTIDGAAGRLFTVVDTFTGTIFAITDSVGIPILSSDNTGTIVIGQYKGTLDVRTTATISRLVTGNISTTTELLLRTADNTRFQIGSTGQWGIGGANYGTTGSLFVSNGPNVAPSWTTTIGTSTSTITMAGPVAFNKSFNEIVAALTISAGTLSLDLSTAGIFEVSLNAAITTMTVLNLPASGKAASFILIFNYTGPYTVAWPVSFRWPSGIAPVLTNTNGKRDIFTVFTTDSGTSYNAFTSGQNL